MKPEPLKDKKVASFDAEYCKEGTFFKDKDIKSAVEWFKEELKKDLEIQLKAKRKGQAVKLDFALHLIDEAFEDVIKD